MNSTTDYGVWPAAATPLNADLSLNEDRFLTHCRRLLDEGAHGLSLLGTTGEANSLPVSERMRALDVLVEAGIPGGQLMPGTGCCSLADTIALSQHAVKNNCAGVLFLPPFYYKGISEEGLYTVVSRVIDSVMDSRLRIYLYHIPQVSGIPWTLHLIKRLVRDYPDHVVGMKDSAGQWENTQEVLETLPELKVFPGSEAFMLPALKIGAVGCISATANVNVRAIRELYDNWRNDDAEAMNESVIGVRRIFEAYPLIPAIKEILAKQYDDREWRCVSPPLEELSISQKRALESQLAEAGNNN